MSTAGAGERSLVLIVEDDEPIADLLAQVVRELAGVDTVIVPDLDDAPRDRRVDLVITDLIGAETFRPEAGRRYLTGLRTLYSTVPILLLTGQQWARDAAKALPVDGILMKPFDIDELTANIRMLLHAHRRSAADRGNAERAGHPVRDGGLGAFDKKEVAQL